MTISTVILDFDGVVVDSVAVKGHGFVSLFDDCSSEAKRWVFEYHLRNAGMGRKEKFKAMYSRCYDRPPTEEEMAVLDEKLRAYCVRHVAEAPFIRGAREFITDHHEDLALYIASSTPETELRSIVDGRGLLPYLRGAFGAPTPKAQICRSIVQQESALRSETVLVGDAVNDLNAAREAGIVFIARVDDRRTDQPVARGADLVIENLSELERSLESVPVQPA